MAAASAGPRSGSPTAALVAGSIRTTVPEARTQTTPSAPVMLPARGGGMTAANRPRSKAGTVAPAGVGGGWVDLEVLEVPAMSVHAAASSTATTSAWCQRGTRGGDGRSLAGVGMAHLADPPVERLDPADVLFQGREADGLATRIHVVGIFQQGRTEAPVLLPADRRPVHLGVPLGQRQDLLASRFVHLTGAVNYHTASHHRSRMRVVAGSAAYPISGTASRRR